MAGPPDNVEARELWQKLNEHPAPSEVVDFPRAGIDQKVRIQVLRHVQHDSARLKAVQRLKERGIKVDAINGNALLEEVQGDAVAKEIIAMSCVTVKPIPGSEEGSTSYGRMFVDGAHIEQALTADEISTLFNLYMLVQHKFGPTPAHLANDEDVDAWITRLAEGGSEFPLAQLPWPQLAGLALSLAQRHSTLCQHLASQLSSLPDTLASELESWRIGTYFSGSPLDESTKTGLDEAEVEAEAGALLEQDDIVTAENARHLMEKIRK